MDMGPKFRARLRRDVVENTVWEDPYGVELSDEDVAEILGEREYDRAKGN